MWFYKKKMHSNNIFLNFHEKYFNTNDYNKIPIPKLFSMQTTLHIKVMYFSFNCDKFIKKDI